MTLVITAPRYQPFPSDVSVHEGMRSAYMQCSYMQRAYMQHALDIFPTKVMFKAPKILFLT